VRFSASILILGAVLGSTSHAVVSKKAPPPPILQSQDVSTLNFVCKAEALNTLSKWEPATGWKSVLVDSAEGAKAMHSPTSKVGVWLNFKTNRKETTLVRSTQDNAVSVHFKMPACTPGISTEQFDAKLLQTKGRAFTDSDLVNTLAASKAKNTKGIIYTWSPRMNLSVTGAKEAIDYAKKEKLNITLLADPEVPTQELESVMKAKGLPESAVVRMGSSDLANRGILIHFPVMILYSDGKMINKIRPGYAEPKRFDQYVKESLKL
jgi:hypothetical protein